ncbi:MAG TPA: hypothetical protein PLC12_03920 [Candidatus Methanofastidiosa archaeon]|nr:hypothetical protein [Candidatus Methanofastidiosa archaeon]
MKQTVLDTIMEIREEIGMDYRSPVIVRVSKSRGTLFIECEDRADKSIVIGAGGWVVGKLTGRLNLKDIKVESRLDNIVRTRDLINSLRSLDSLENEEFVHLSKAIIQGKTPEGCRVYVMGEEMMWACAMLEDLGCSPVLLHTEFVHDNVKGTYGGTEFRKVKAPISPYPERLEAMVSSVLDDPGDGSDRIFMGLFEKTLEERDGSILVNPMEFYRIDLWQTRKYSRKRFKERIFEHSDENKGFMVRKVLDWCSNGLIEPNDAARIIHTHWTDGTLINVGRTDMDGFTRKYRVRNSLSRSKEVSEDVHRILNNYLTGNKDHIGLRALIAWSGGIDSSACIEVALKAGLEADLVTVKMPFIDMIELRTRAGAMGLELGELELPERYPNICKSVESGNIHPCGQCSSMIEEAIKEYAIGKGYDLLIFGDLLSVGSQSVLREDGLILLNLPAALSLSKRELMTFSEGPTEISFGCPLVNMAHGINRDSQRISIQRVLRELRAGMLDNELALELINDIKTPPERYIYDIS